MWYQLSNYRTVPLHASSKVMHSVHKQSRLSKQLGICMAFFTKKKRKQERKQGELSIYRDATSIASHLNPSLQAHSPQEGVM